MRCAKSNFTMRSLVLIFYIAILILWALLPMQKPILGQAANEVNGKLYTNVITDLTKDITFDADCYPALDDGDYSLNVIQVAEGVSGEVFVYVYEPRREQKAFNALFLNMALSDTVNDTKLYDLQFINASGVFSKYIIVGVTVSTNNERFYNISSIYRVYDAEIDDPVETEQYKNAVAFHVGKCFRATTKNDTVTYDCKEVKTIQILNPFADYIRYTSGFFLYDSGACDAHYVAFDTDIEIDYLLTASISFKTTNYLRVSSLYNNTTTKKGEKRYDNYKVSHLQTGETVEKGFFAHEPHNWHRIERTSDFVEKEELTEATKRSLIGTKWVLRFIETSYSETVSSTGGGTSIFWTAVSNVTVLRLEFLVDGKVWNMGAVSDMVTEDEKPGNTDIYDTGTLSIWERIWNAIVNFFKSIIDFFAKYWWIIFVIIGVILLIIFFPIVGPILWAVVKIILNALWWLITLPFRVIAAIIHKIRGDGSG